ncbi:hypothetical protein DNH61_21155 [Paenibacillus sambharensis]|uniref:Radical SAM protein n=1 Tax=Paenibacillus sambharensis TaxID=1803190 RepID=A0A2W1L3S0_9BACL|nr:hypothetical protein [Paenibacillus sambharensis]PZD93996.1 hypothetical protein DNH61_21155 [Paenibacillus sambharensis]
MKISDSSRTLFHGDRVILMNRKTGAWLKISKECFDILEVALEQHLTRDELLNRFQEAQDRQYFNGLLAKLDELGYWEIPHSPHLREVSFSLTQRCNLQCTHCIVDALNTSTSDCLSTADIINICVYT